MTEGAQTPPTIPPSFADDDRLFSEPWHAQVFAMTVSLNEAGYFSWDQWSKCFTPILERWQASDTDADVNATYYSAWLEAIETLLTEIGVTTQEALDELKDAWDEAAQATPHGEPIVLGNKAE